ncbi:Transposase, IS1634 family [Crocosphaera watsonii WH 0003]|uniref:Transposase, IS1634 family n=1 Tax=Crocosphaera watsonii WH 0003 TaxID=423471 RepID=G5IZP9_CROWT|nr:Transposase, IS1634 family [Crocosphaera watsonii WH 0003]
MTFCEVNYTTSKFQLKPLEPAISNHN